MCCTHSAPGVLEEHPGLSGPDLQMSSPGTARLDRHYHSLPSSSLLTASPYSSSLTSHAKQNAGADQIWQFAFRCCFGDPVVRLCGCRTEVTAADSYLRGCWRATRGARLLPFSSGSISSRLGKHHVTETVVKTETTAMAASGGCFHNKTFTKKTFVPNAGMDDSKSGNKMHNGSTPH